MQRGRWAYCGAMFAPVVVGFGSGSGAGTAVGGGDGGPRGDGGSGSGTDPVRDHRTRGGPSIVTGHDPLAIDFMETSGLTSKHSGVGTTELV